jgi:hypothetical protein
MLFSTSRNEKILPIMEVNEYTTGKLLLESSKKTGITESLLHNGVDESLYLF